MEFIFTECAGEEGEIRTRLQSGPYGSFSMFHYLCNQAFGMQHDFKVEFVKNHVPVETGGGWVMLEKTDAKARTKHKDINKLLSATVKEWHVLPSKDFAKLKAMSKDSVLRENPSGKQNDNAPLHELISLFIAQLSQEQCAHILKEFGVAITDFDTDFKKRLAELFMETLQDGYKEYKLIENNVEKEEDDDD